MRMEALRFGDAYRIRLTKHPQSQTMAGMSPEQEAEWANSHIGLKMTFTPGMDEKWDSFTSDGVHILLDNRKSKPGALTEENMHAAIRHERETLMAHYAPKAVPTDEFNAPFAKWERFYKDKALADPDLPTVDVQYCIEPRPDNCGPTPISFFSDQLADWIEQRANCLEGEFADNPES